MAEVEPLLEKLCQRLKLGTKLKLNVPVRPGAHYVPAAVLIPMFIKDGELHILLTVRTNKVEHHKREISFPGGAYKEEDVDLRDTALREMEEEIGLHPRDVEVLGQLNGLLAWPHYVVCPFVGLFPYPYELVPYPAEVDKLIEVPLNHLLDEGNRRQVVYDGGWVSYYFDYQGYIIWGVTAFIIKEFLELLV